MAKLISIFLLIFSPRRGYGKICPNKQGT